MIAMASRGSRTRVIILGGVLLAIGWVVLTLTFHGRNLGRLRALQTEDCFDPLKVALTQCAIDCGCVPIHVNEEMPLGTDCEHPGPLVRYLVSRGYLASPIVRDAFGSALIVRGGGDPVPIVHVDGGTSGGGRCPDWFRGDGATGFFVISTGADGKRDNLPIPDDTRPARVDLYDDPDLDLIDDAGGTKQAWPTDGWPAPPGTVWPYILMQRQLDRSCGCFRHSIRAPKDSPKD